MAGVNKVILIGHLGADPEVKRTQSGAPVASLRLATSDQWRDKESGERKERTGRAAPRGRVIEARKVEVRFERRADACLYCILDRAIVGVICEQPPGGRPGFNWICMLPEQRVSPQFAADLEKAKGAVRRAVEGWCECAGLVMRPRQAPAVRVWRAPDGGGQ